MFEIKDDASDCTSILTVHFNYLMGPTQVVYVPFSSEINHFVPPNQKVDFFCSLFPKIA